MSADKISDLRQTVFDDLANVRRDFERALRDDASSNVFIWHEEAFWVDRKRCFVIPDASVERIEPSSWSQADTLPASDFEASELLDIYAGEHQHEDTSSIVQMLAGAICGSPPAGWRLTGAKFINLAVSQSRINAAFSSLLWLALAEDIGLHGDCRSNLFDLLTPMMFLQVRYPELTESPADIRREQISFLEQTFPGSTHQGLSDLSDADWALFCKAQLDRNMQFVDDRLFSSLFEHVLSLKNSRR